MRVIDELGYVPDEGIWASAGIKDKKVCGPSFFYNLVKEFRSKKPKLVLFKELYEQRQGFIYRFGKCWERPVVEQLRSMRF